jgi:hypothetical protein
VNDRDEIRDAFKTYFEGAEMGEEVDPARMYQLTGELDASGIYLAEEVERFCAVYFKPKPINPDFQPIELTDREEGELQVVAELVEVLGPDVSYALPG